MKALHLHPAFIFAVSRFLVFLACVGILYLFGLRSFTLLFAALLVSTPVAFVLLRKQRESVAEGLSHRRHTR